MGLEDLEQLLGVVAVGRKRGTGHHVGDLAAQDRDVAGRHGLGRRGRQPEQLALADAGAVGVEAPDADELQPVRAVDRGVQD